MLAQLVIAILVASATRSRATTGDDQVEPLLFTWTDVTLAEEPRRLQNPGSGDFKSAFVQRTPSNTSRIFELAHGPSRLPVAFEDDHHGLKEGSLVKLPVCAFNGRLHTFRLHASRLIPFAVQRKFPGVRSYHAFEVRGSMSAEVTVGPDGLRAQIWMSDAETLTCYVDPHTVGRTDKYTVYSYKDPRLDGQRPVPISPSLPSGKARRIATDALPRRLVDASDYVFTPATGLQTYRTYRICVAVSPDYMTFASSKGTTAMSLLTATLARASGIWRRVLSIDLQMCDDQDKLFKSKKEGNPLPDGNPDAFLDSCGDFLSTMGVTSEMYDLAHYFSASGGGGLGGCCTCGESKCAGGTALANPVGDPFDVDYVAHEMGHQFGHGHTFSGAKGNCGSNFMAGESVEPGSGHTILSYAGICDSDNTHKQSTPYFASVSLGIYARGQVDTSFEDGQMMTCGTVTQTTNNRPTATTLATCAVPKRTPFVLRGSGSDPDPNTVLTYNWEQVDSASKPTPLDEENKVGALFASVAPSIGGHTRNFPKLTTAVKNRGTLKVDPLERLSTIKRDLHFTMTVRDQYNGAGGSSADSAIGTWHAGKTTVNVGKVGPLKLTKPEDPSLETGAVTVEWRLFNHKATDAASKLLKIADYNIEYASCESSIEECTDTPKWDNGYGEGCNTYASLKYCTKDGGKGDGWETEEWGEWDIVPADGPIKEKPSVACCACGGGNTKNICQPGDFTPLVSFKGVSSWKLALGGTGRARVNVPHSIAGTSGVLRVITGASSEAMSAEVYCKTFAVSRVFEFKQGLTSPVALMKSIPSNGTTGVINTNLQLVLVFDRDVSLSGDADSRFIDIASVDSGSSYNATIAGTSARIIVAGNTMRITIGDVGSYEIWVTIPDGLIQGLEEQKITFSTSTRIAVAPTITGTQPADGATEILLNSTVIFTLSENAMPGSGAVGLLDWESDLICSVLAEDMDFDEASRTASFGLMDMGCFLYQGYEHTLHVDKDAFYDPLGGIGLEDNVSVSFFAWNDTTPPRVVATDPLNGSRFASTMDTIFVYFDEDIYPGSLGNIIIKPRELSKHTHILPVADEDQVTMSWMEDFTGELSLWSWYELDPRTTYDVIIPEGAIVDWPGNLAEAYKLTFRTGDNVAPYCDNVESSQEGPGEDLKVMITFVDEALQTEPSTLVRGKSGLFWLINLDDKLQTVSISITDKVRVHLTGLVVTVVFPSSELFSDATYTLRWPDNIVLDDLNNPIYGSKHQTNRFCNSTLVRPLPGSSNKTGSTASSARTTSPASADSTTNTNSTSKGATVSGGKASLGRSSLEMETYVMLFALAACHMA